MRYLLTALLVFLSGCTTMDTHRIVSPAESIYYRANESYEERDFEKAIELYNEYLEKRPRSKLAVAAKLNLGMSYYFNGDFFKAYNTLKDLDPKDESIKAYLKGVLEVCEREAGDKIKVEQAAKEQVAQPTGTGTLKIQVTDAYIDDFGSLIIKGKTSVPATVVVDRNQVALDASNAFTASVRWRKGQPVLINATDPNGATGELNYFPDGERPEKPEGLREVNTSANSAGIEWDENDENDIKGYRLYYRLRGGTAREVPDLIKDDRHEVVGLQTYVEGANKTFEFYIRAVDKMNNESEDSDILEVTLP